MAAPTHPQARRRATRPTHRRHPDSRSGPPEALPPAAPLRPPVPPVRTECAEAVQLLRAALAADDTGPAWCAAVEGAARRLSWCLHQRVRAAQGSDGLFADALRSEPRLASRVHRMTRCQAELAHQVADLVAAVSARCAPQGAGSAASAAQTRLLGARLLVTIERCDRMLSDLLAEADHRDLGVSD